MLLRRAFTVSKSFVSFRFASAEAALPLKEGSSAALPHQDRSVSSKVQQLVDEISGLSILEVSDLNWALKKKLNLPDVPMGMMSGMAMAAPAPAAAAADEAAASDAPQKMTFAVKLTKFNDAQKIALIKEIRTIVPGLNLVQAKKFVETAPVTVKEDMGKAEAEELKAALEKVGATCELA